MTRAVWHGAVLAESDDTILIEGNHYFPPADLNWDYFIPSDRHTTCWWKGVASYYDVVVEGQTNAASAWYYPKPSQEAHQIKDHVAFWRGIRVEG